jgi:Xaa-Pro dipeptidase
MSIFSMMGASRFALIVNDGPVVVWEFAGSEHLGSHATTIDDIRTAPGLTAMSGPGYVDAVQRFASEVASICGASASQPQLLGVERMDHPITDALRDAGFLLASATETFVDARRIKVDDEIVVMREAMQRVINAVDVMRAGIEPGRTEIEVWSELHRSLIASDGEYISTRLVQAGQRTFPYFQEAGANMLSNGDLFCVDTDAIGFGGYGVDFSRTFLCGDKPASAEQRQLHRLAVDQLEHNASRLGPGVRFEHFARDAWSVSDRYAPYGYHCLAHGLGLSGEHPYIPIHEPDQPYPLDGVFESGMVICVESYLGDIDEHHGVKVEDQFLITNDGVERMSHTDLDTIG